MCRRGITMPQLPIIFYILVNNCAHYKLQVLSLFPQTKVLADSMKNTTPHHTTLMNITTSTAMFQTTHHRKLTSFSELSAMSFPFTHLGGTEGFGIVYTKYINTHSAHWHE